MPGAGGIPGGVLRVECDRVWAADLTYLWTRAGWLYLAVVLDLASRRVVGWCADGPLDQTLTLRALQMALHEIGSTPVSVFTRVDPR